MTARRLRPDLPFRRIALVLSGGGALGAYEVGVLKVLEALALAPAMVAGVSVGAINAVMWLANDRKTAPLEETWRELRPAHVGLRWVGLALRTAGALGAVVAFLEILLTVTGSREMSGAYWFWGKASGTIDLWSTQLDILSWVVVAFAGLAVVYLSPRIEDWMSSGGAAGDPANSRRMLGLVTLGWAALHSLVWAMGWPWPHRFSASLLIGLLLAWVGSGGGSIARWMRRMAFGLMPETGGRGLWGGLARRRVLEGVVAQGDASRVMRGGTQLVISALAVDSGRVTHFINWPNPSDEFVARVEHDLGAVVSVRTSEEVIRAAIASSAIPGVFEPERIDGRDYVDVGGFSNQPIHVAIANDADAVLVVLLTPSLSPTPSPPPSHILALAGRLLELANWRDLQTELRHLPDGWSRAGAPARVCVVEPDRALPGAVLGFDPGQAAQLIALGEQDAWHALVRSGWVEPAPSA